MAATSASNAVPPEGDLAWFVEQFDALRSAVGSVLVGKASVVELSLLGLVVGGHVLIDDVPGVGKTTLAKAIGNAVGGTVNRIQFTPDLLPTDITGAPVWHPGDGTFELRPGPIFANVVLADEINRASPKTQSALLEVMEEGAVTIDGQTLPVPDPFFVIATQNPIELRGTYPLPEAQIDRFLMALTIGYPDVDAEVEAITNHVRGIGLDGQVPVVDLVALRTMRAVAREIHVAPTVVRYAVELAAATRRSPQLRLGASPRGSRSLVLAGQARAAADGRSFVTPDDIKALVEPVLAHRVILTATASAEGTDAVEVLRRAVAEVDVPARRAGPLRP